MRKVTFAAALAALALSGAAMAETWANIEAADLNAAIKSKQVVVLDCNGSESYQQGHLPGAIDFQANKDKLAALLPKNKDTVVVAYCGGPQCHAYEAGAKAVSQMGYHNVKHFTGGLQGWKAAKLPLAK